MEQDGRINFSTGIDNGSLQRDASESVNILHSIGDAAEQQGDRLDSIFSGLKDISREAAAIFADLSRDFDVSDAEHKIEALKSVIQTNTETVDELKAKFSELGAQAQEAFAQGNFTEFDSLTSQMERTAASISEISAETDRFSTVLESMQAAAGGAASALEQTSQQEQQSSGVLVTLLGGQEKYNALLKEMPDSLQAAAKGITGMTGAAKAFIATPLGAILAAIILAVKAVKTWFDSAAEGQMAFAKVSGYVSGVLGQLKEIVIAVGKALYKAFSNPKEAISELWKAIKENIVNRFKALGDMAASLGKVLKAAFTFDVEGIKAGVKELADSFLMFGTGIEDVTGKIGDWTRGVNDAAKATSEIAAAQRQLEIEVSEWQKRREELEQVKADARIKMYDTSLSQGERAKALNQYKSALDEQVRIEKDFAQRRIDLQKRSMSLTSNTIEDENTLRDLEAAKLRIDTQAKNELAMLQRRANSITNPKGGAAATDDKTEQELLALQRRNTQAEIDAMAEGAEKKIAQLRFDYEREIAEVKAQEAKWREAQGGSLTEAQKGALDAAFQSAESKRKKGEALISQEEIDAALRGIETYEQRRTALQKEFAEKRKALYVDGDAANGLRGGVSQGNIDELNRNEKQALQAIDNEFASREASFEVWCNEIASLSLEQLSAVLERAQEELAALEASGDESAANLPTARAKVAKAQAALDRLNSENATAPSKRSIKEWEDLYKVLNECCGTFKEIGDTVGGVAGEFISAAGTIASSTLSMINGITQLVQMSSAAMSGTAKTAATAISTVEKASIILAVVSSAMQVATTIIDLFNSDDARQDRIDALQGEIDSLQWLLDNSDTARLQEQYGKALDNVVKTYGENLQKVYSTLSKQEKTLFRLTNGALNGQAALAKSAEDLAKGYANVAYTADKALGAAKFDDARAQLENLSQQQILLYEQLEQEKNKKKADDSAIQDYEQKIEELGKQAVDIINELTEEIVGGSATEIANELADAFFDAFQAGEDYAEAWGDKVNEIVADVVKRMLISQFLEAPLGEVFDKYKNKWFRDGNFSGVNSVIGSMEAFAADLNVVGNDFAAIWENLPSSVRDMFTVTAEGGQEASSKGIATASQDTVDELNGRMTAVQGHTYSICENTKLLVANTASILESVMNIEVETDGLGSRMAAVESGVKEMRNTLNDIAQKGIKIK